MKGARTVCIYTQVPWHEVDILYVPPKTPDKHRRNIREIIVKRGVTRVKTRGLCGAAACREVASRIRARFLFPL